MSMKISLSFILIMLICACGSDGGNVEKNVEAGMSIPASNTDSGQKNLKLIRESSVGQFAKGDLIDLSIEDDDLSLQRTPFRDTLKGKVDIFYSFVRTGEEAIRIIPAYDHRNEVYSKLIGEILIQSDEYKDAFGIGVGSSVSDFKNTYPKAYAYYDCAADKLLLSNQGSGPQYIVSADAISMGDGIPVGRVNMSKVNGSSKIELVKIVRTKQENEEAKINNDMEEQEILEKYLESVSGNYYPKGYSEKYYKIHKKQGDYFVSECFEDECKNKGKVIESEKSMNGFVSLKLDGVSGQMVPSWSVKKVNDKEMHLNVYDYDGINDKWSNTLFVQKEE